MSAEASDRFQILALDGGGLKGIFSAAALAQLERDFNVSLAQHFDLITGTSTGGLVALGLAAGRSASELADFYLAEGPRIFRRTPMARLGRLRRPHDPEPLRRALAVILGDMTLADSPVRLAIPAFDQASNDVYLFRTPHLPTLRRDHRETLVDVALATTAAPTFLPAHRLDGLRLIDGGVWANNPSMVGLVEAVASCQVPVAGVRILNVGTSTEVTYRSERLDTGSALRWVKPIVDVVLRGQALAATNHARLLLGSEKVHRLDVHVPKGLHALDRVDAQNLMGLAQAASRKFSPEIGYMFEHRSTPYRNFALGDPTS